MKYFIIALIIVLIAVGMFVALQQKQAVVPAGINGDTPAPVQQQQNAPVPASDLEFIDNDLKAIDIGETDFNEVDADLKTL